jgi:hypothetical protein
MSQFIDLTGKRFWRFIVIKRVDNDKCGNLCWLCKCDCGMEKIVRSGDIKSGSIKSCGCLRKEKVTKHGHSNNKTYISWKRMIQRCTNPNDKDYHYYSGRNIKVCREWLKFENFLQDMGERPLRHTIERIDNNKGYYKSNCRWATRKQQQRNKCNNHLKTYNGKTQCLSAWSEEFAIPENILRGRIRRGWSMDKTLKTPL